MKNPLLNELLGEGFSRAELVELADKNYTLERIKEIWDSLGEKPSSLSVICTDDMSEESVRDIIHPRFEDVIESVELFTTTVFGQYKENDGVLPILLTDEDKNIARNKVILRKEEENYDKKIHPKDAQLFGGYLAEIAYEKVINHFLIQLYSNEVENVASEKRGFDFKHSNFTVDTKCTLRENDWRVWIKERFDDDYADYYPIFIPITINNKGCREKDSLKSLMNNVTGMRFLGVLDGVGIRKNPTENGHWIVMCRRFYSDKWMGTLEYLSCIYNSVVYHKFEPLL